MKVRQLFKQKGQGQEVNSKIEQLPQIPQKKNPVFNFDIVVSIRHNSQSGVSEVVAVNPAYYTKLYSEKITLTGVKNILELAKNHIDNQPVSEEFCLNYEEN